MNKGLLSIIPYYGGKARMAQFIADKLDYDDSSIYIEPFGGACRVLLNKPPHDVEIYNEYSEGLCALMRTMTNRETAYEFIERLYETEYSREQFDLAQKIYNEAEKDLEEQERLILVNIIKNECEYADARTTYRATKLIEAFYRHVKSIEDGKVRYDESIKDKVDIEKIKNHLNGNIELREKLTSSFSRWYMLKKQKEEQGFLERSIDMGVKISEMELSIATYIVFTQSRDSMGKTWTSYKFKSTNSYRKRILQLFPCVERMENVSVSQIDALDYFGRHKILDYEKCSDLDPRYLLINEWANDPSVMMYCDPSYICPYSEEKALEGIEWEKEKSLSEAIKKANRKMPRNLGELYSMSFNYELQETFLQNIQDAKCKILVSNYDLILYNKYLTPEKNWRNIKFETTTGAGGKSNNKRLEVMWYNY